VNGAMLNRKDERVVYMSVVGTVGLKLESGGGVGAQGVLPRV
jgi:hypothetical protein